MKNRKVFLSISVSYFKSVILKYLVNFLANVKIVFDQITGHLIKHKQNNDQNLVHLHSQQQIEVLHNANSVANAVLHTV
jgi:hypothetical protein